MEVIFNFLLKEHPRLGFQRINKNGDIFFIDLDENKEYVASRAPRTNLFYLNNVSITEKEYDIIISYLGTNTPVQHIIEGGQE